MGQKQANVSPMLFFGGLVVGSILTAMLTPSSGRDMRVKLKSKADRMSEKMKKTAEDIKETAAETKQEGEGALKKSLKKTESPSDITPPMAS